jgi:acetyl esterase
MRGLDADTMRALERMGADLEHAPVQPTIEERRSLMRRMALDYGPEPAEVARVENCLIAGPGGALSLRIYWPLGATKARPPILLHIHGGGWAIGDPDAYERVCRAYCAAGDCIVVDVHYRRAPEHKYPAALDDCEAALRWLVGNAAELGGDPARIGVTGDSAGGNLAAALCQRATAAVALQVLIYPVMSARADAHFASRSELGDGSYFLREFDIKNAESEYLADPRDGDELGASPLSAPDALLARLPPTLIITAEFDPLRDEGAAYAERLRKAGAPVTYWCAEGTIHAFVLFAGMIAQGRAAIATVGDAVRAMRAGAPGLT